MGNDNPADFAEKVGVTVRTLHNYLSGQMPRFTIRTKICEAYGINPMWLFQGVGSMYAEERMTDMSAIEGDLSPKRSLAEDQQSHVPYANDKKTGDMSPVPACSGRHTGENLPPDGVQPIFIPKVQARLSAGSGSLEVDADVDGFFAFRSSWIRKKGCPSKMVLMTVSGDSMSPTIENGDMVLINQGLKDVIAGGIYAVGVDDSILVKRLDKKPGKIVLISDNREAYAPMELSLTDETVQDSLRIIGRVLWWCREA